MLAHEQATELYRTWWNVVQTGLRQITPPGFAASFAVPPPTPAPQPASEAVTPFVEALDQMRNFATRFYGAFIPGLGGAQGGMDWQGWMNAQAAQWQGLADSATAQHKQLLEAGGQMLAQLAGQGAAPGSIGSMLTTLSGPLEGLDRTFSALADAFGLGPSKALREAWQELLAADEARRKAQLGYFAVMGGAAIKVMEGVAKQLGEMAARGEQVDSLLGWVRLWAGVADTRVHQAMQSEAGLKASVEYMRAALRYGQQRNRVVEIVSGLMNVPTRSEVDDAYREIQQLKREVRALSRDRGVPAGESPQAGRGRRGRNG